MRTPSRHQVFAGLIGWLSIWLSVALPVVVGHAYGATIYFFKIWAGDWPCFRGQMVRETDYPPRYRCPTPDSNFDLPCPKLVNSQWWNHSHSTVLAVRATIAADYGTKSIGTPMGLQLSSAVITTSRNQQLSRPFLCDDGHPSVLRLIRVVYAVGRSSGSSLHSASPQKRIEAGRRGKFTPDDGPSGANLSDDGGAAYAVFLGRAVQL